MSEQTATRSLSDLRNEPPSSRPERALTISLRPDVVGRIHALNPELGTLPEPEPAPEPKRVRNMAQKTDPADEVPLEHPRATEIRAEMADLIEVGRVNEGTLTVRANKSDGEWRNWVNAHPARAEDEPGHEYDQRLGAGIVNVDDLIDDLAAYAHAWNGEELQPGDWAGIFDPTIGEAQKGEVAEVVVSMYERRLDFRQWRSGLSTSLQRWRDSVSPESSASPPSDSTDGNPAPSSEATTSTAAE